MYGVSCASFVHISTETVHFFLRLKKIGTTVVGKRFAAISYLNGSGAVCEVFTK